MLKAQAHLWVSLCGDNNTYLHKWPEHQPCLQTHKQWVWKSCTHSMWRKIPVVTEMKLQRTQDKLYLSTSVTGRHVMRWVYIYISDTDYEWVCICIYLQTHKKTKQVPTGWAVRTWNVSNKTMQLQPDCPPTHLVCVQEFFSPVLHDVLFALQEAHTWVINRI